MTLATCPFARVLLTALLATTSAAVLAASAEPLDLDPEILAKLAKEKARATSQARQTANAGKAGPKGEANATVECGTVAIGNVNSGSRIGFAPTDVNVIIVGDVINANNKCK